MSHRFADLILERDFESEWAEIRTAIAEITMPSFSSGLSRWNHFRSEFISSLTRFAWSPDLPIPARHGAHPASGDLHVDLEKHGVAVMVASQGRDLYADLFALNAAASGDADVGVYVVATSKLAGEDEHAVPTWEQLFLPLRYRLGGTAMPVAVVGADAFGGAPGDAGDDS